MTDTSKKPREFHLYIDPYGYDDSICEVTGQDENRFWNEQSKFAKPHVHVIEYQAYQSLLEQCEKLEKAWEIFFKGFELDGVTKEEADIKEQSFNDSLFLARQALAEFKKFKEEL